MQDIISQFDIVFNQHKIRVQELRCGRQELFRVIFDDETPLLVLTHSMDLWDSVPEGRQEHAEQIGGLIGQRRLIRK